METGQPGEERSNNTIRVWMPIDTKKRRETEMRQWESLGLTVHQAKIHKKKKGDGLQ